MLSNETLIALIHTPLLSNIGLIKHVTEKMKTFGSPSTGANITWLKETRTLLFWYHPL